MIWLEFIRNQELVSIRKYLSDNKTKKILEIGGKDGYIAKILEGWGFEVTSIDVNPSSTYFDVKKMDATNMQFESNLFDIVFSSHVIAHIENKDLLFTEIDRVLKREGLIMHIVPSNWWSLITNFWHYILLPKIIYEKIKHNKKTDSSEKQNSNVSNQNKNKLMNLLFYHPLGTEKSFVNEIDKFSKRKWNEFFVSNGYTIKNSLNGPLVYSGYSVFENQGIKIRKIFSAVFPSSYVFVMTKHV